MKRKVIFQILTEIECDSNDDLKDIMQKHVTGGDIIPYNTVSTEFNGYELQFIKVLKGEAQ